MLRATHPELLAADWVPPVLVERSLPVRRAVELLTEDPAGSPRTRSAAIVGPSGSGTSAVARKAAVELVEEQRRTVRSPPPMIVPVSVRHAAGTGGVAQEMVRRLDAGFESRGFLVAEVLAGFLRRLMRARRGAVVLLDDIGPDAPDLAPVLKAVLTPGRFLPEGVETAPPLWLLLAGSDDGRSVWDRAQKAGIGPDRRVALAPYTPSQLLAIARDRGQRALGRPPPDGWAERLSERTVRSGAGARRLLQLIRQELAEPTPRPGIVPRIEIGGGPQRAVEPRLLLALEKATVGGPTALRDLRAWEARLAREEGVRPLPATTLWRRIVRLEAAGVIRREVRQGGDGGTVSRLELLQPLEGPGEFTGRPETLRESGWGPELLGA